MTRLGRTNLDVFKLGLGGIPLIKLSMGEARKVIRASIDGGINFADTADVYGDSEEKLSLALKGDRDRFIIASKSPCRDAAGMKNAIDQSLSRLQTDYIDLYQVHALKTAEQLGRIFGPGGAMEALKQAQTAGKIRFIGVTGHRPSILVQAIKTGEFDTVMPPVNVVDREAEEELLPLAKELDIGIIAMKPVCGGTLDDPALGIRFCLNSPADSVLVGMKSLAEVEANLSTFREFRPLSTREEEDLLENASQLGNTFCRRCEYCQPCPQGINIPKILWLANYHRRYAERDPWTEDEYRAIAVSASDCEECGDCEEKCPYDLPVRQMLKDADQELIPPPALVARRRLKRAVKKFLPIRGSTED